MRDGHNGWDGVEMIWTQATGHTHTLDSRITQARENGRSHVSTPGSGRSASPCRRSSWAGARPGCWAGRLPGRWSRPGAACSAPRRCGWPAGGGGG